MEDNSINTNKKKTFGDESLFLLKIDFDSNNIDYFGPISINYDPMIDTIKKINAIDKFDDLNIKLPIVKLNKQIIK